MVPSSCASSTAVSICENRGPGVYPMRMRSCPRRSGSGRICSAPSSSSLRRQNSHASRLPWLARQSSRYSSRSSSKLSERRNRLSVLSLIFCTSLNRMWSATRWRTRCMTFLGQRSRLHIAAAISPPTLQWLSNLILSRTANVGGLPTS